MADCETYASRLFRNEDFFLGSALESRFVQQIDSIHSLAYLGVVSTIPGYEKARIFAKSNDGISYLNDSIDYMVEILKQIKSRFDERTLKYRCKIETLITTHRNSGNKVGEKIATGVLKRLQEYQQKCSVIFWNLKQVVIFSTYSNLFSSSSFTGLTWLFYVAPRSLRCCTEEMGH